jgi:hypothetical protein
LLGIVTDPMSFNRYPYCNADPVNNDDPTGLMLIDQGRGNINFEILPLPSPGDPAGWGPVTSPPPCGCPGYVSCGRCAGFVSVGGTITVWTVVVARIAAYVDRCHRLWISAGLGLGGGSSGHVSGGRGCIIKGWGWGFGGGGAPPLPTGPYFGKGPGGFEGGVSSPGASVGGGYSGGGWSL